MRSTRTPAYRFLLDRLIKARTQAGWTQTEVSAALQWPQSRISRMESGERRIDAIELRDLAKLYRKRITHFIPR